MMQNIPEWARPSSASRYLNWQSCVRLLAVTAALFTFYSLNIYLTNGYANDALDFIDGDPEVIPHRIYQTWSMPTNLLVDPYKKWQASWPAMNPNHRYELITDAAAMSYVKAKYKHEPEIITTFTRISDPILRADYIRYLMLLADGGVYTDLDTVCVKPIDQWVPEKMQGSIRMVVGLEFDARGMDISGRKDFMYPIQFSQWTLMSAPGHPFLQAITDIVTKNLVKLGEGQPEIKAVTQADVLKTTGPMVFTTAMMLELSRQAGQTVRFEDLADMQEGKQFGTILVLPIDAFTAGAPHSNASKFGESPQQLIEHHFQGYNTWRTVHSGPSQ